MRKKLLILALALISLTSLTLGASAFSVFADTANTPDEVSLTMQDGAYVRISDDDSVTGMKYVMQMPASEYDALKANENYTVSFGILIAPSVYETTYGELTVDNVFGENAKYDWAIEQADGSFKYEGNKTRIINLMTDEMSKTGDVYSFNGCIYELKDKNIAADFIGKGYMKYTYTEGGEQKNAYRFANVVEKESEVKVIRSMAYVAQKACAAENNALSDTEKSTIRNRYLDKVADVEKTYTVETYDSNGKLLDTTTETGKLGTPATALTDEIKITKNNEINCYVYDSENANNQLTGTVWADGSLVLKRSYKTSSVIYKSYNDFKVYNSNYDTYEENTNWNYGNRISVQVDTASVENSALPDAVKSETENYGGAFHVLNDGVPYGATKYCTGIKEGVNTFENIDGNFKLKNDNIMLPQEWLTGLPSDYTAVSYRVYVEPYEGKTATYGVYTTNQKTEYVKNLAEGWNTIYLAKSDFGFICTDNNATNGERLPLGLFSNVKELYLAYIGYELGATHNLLIKDTDNSTAEATELNSGWSVNTETSPEKTRYTLTACSYDENGQQLISDVSFATSGKTIYVHYVEGTILNALNETQDIVVDTFNYNYYWSASEKISTNTNIMFESRDTISTDIASGMYVGSKGMLHVIKDTKVGNTEDSNHSHGRSIWLRTGVNLPENYDSVLIRVYVEVDDGETGKHFFFDNTSPNTYSSTVYSSQDLTTGWYTLSITKDQVAKQNVNVSSYFGIGHFGNVKNLYIDYIAVK